MGLTIGVNLEVFQEFVDLTFLTTWLFFLFQFTLRDEKKKINAVKDFYDNTKFTDENIVKILTMFGKLGTPMIFLTFAGIYWTTGILKYYFVWFEASAYYYILYRGIFMECHRAVVQLCKVLRTFWDVTSSRFLSEFKLFWELQNLRWTSMKIPPIHKYLVDKFFNFKEIKAETIKLHLLALERIGELSFSL